MRESRMLGSVRAKAEWLSYSTIPHEVADRAKLSLSSCLQLALLSASQHEVQAEPLVALLSRTARTDPASGNATLGCHGGQGSRGGKPLGGHGRTLLGGLCRAALSWMLASIGMSGVAPLLRVPPSPWLGGGWWSVLE